MEWLLLKQWFVASISDTLARHEPVQQISSSSQSMFTTGQSPERMSLYAFFRVHERMVRREVRAKATDTILLDEVAPRPARQILCEGGSSLN